MKILHVIDSGGLFGAEVMLLNLASEQRKIGLEPVIASIAEPGITEKALESQARKKGIEIRRFDMHRGYSMSGAKRIVSYAIENGFNLYHSHGYKGNILLGLLPKRFRVLPVVVTLHGYIKSKKISKGWLYQVLDRYLLFRNECIVCVSMQMLKDLKLKSRKNCQTFIIHNGISRDVEAEGLRITNHASDTPSSNSEDHIIKSFAKGNIVIGSVGRLSTEKGYDILLNAFKLFYKEVPSARLLLVGDGPERQNLRTLAENLGINDAVLFTGYRNDVPYLMRMMDLYVITSWTEGLPITLLEAMRARVAVVGSHVGGIPETLDNGKCGLLVDAGNIIGFKNALVKLVNDVGLRNSLIDYAEKRFTASYTADIMAIKYKEVYKIASAMS